MRKVALVLFAAAWQRQRCLALVTDLTLLRGSLCNARPRGDEKEGGGQPGRDGEESWDAGQVRAEGAKGE